MDDDRLDGAWRRLALVIKQREAELEELRRRFKVLDDARALIVEESTSAESSVRGAAVRDSVPGLQEAVLQAVQEFPADSGGAPSEIARRVRSMGLGSDITRNSFYSSVYVTLIRLSERGEIRALKGAQGRLFAKNEDGGLFRQPSETDGAP